MFYSKPILYNKKEIEEGIETVFTSSFVLLFSYFFLQSGFCTKIKLDLGKKRHLKNKISQTMASSNPGF